MRAGADTASGGFVAHTDNQSLSVLIPCSDPHVDFGGGGTAFWTREHKEASTVEGVAPHLVVRPPPGTAILFGGDVLHSALEVTSGMRVAFVASFSRVEPEEDQGSDGGSGDELDDMLAILERLDRRE